MVTLMLNRNKSSNASENNTTAIKVTFNSSDSQFISDIAKALGISEEDVLRKGLKLMGLYAEALENKQNPKLILEGDKSRKELSIT